MLDVFLFWYATELWEMQNILIVPIILSNTAVSSKYLLHGLDQPWAIRSPLQRNAKSVILS